MTKQEVVYVGKDFKKRAKAKATSQRLNMSAIAQLGLQLYLDDGLGDLIKTDESYAFTDDRLLFVVDSEMAKAAREKLGGETVSDLYRTIFHKWFDGDLQLVLA